jgi:Glycosyl hydrolases family 28
MTQITNLYNVQDFGATGDKAQDAQGAIQSAIEACAQAGGGTVYLPPGQYTSGTLHLRSHVRIHIEAGATLYSSKQRASFDKHALFYAEDAINITLEGRGTVDGQAAYEWRLMDMQDWYIRPNQLLAEQAGLPLLRSFPTPDSYGNLVLFVRCTDVRITDLSFLHSPSWTMHLWGCERLVIDGVYVYTSLKDGVWADGIDPDGCKDVCISNCTIETGDDALVFYSGSSYGPARPCENITVSNCRLSSASSALKFCDGNQNAIRNVTITNCVITGANRGIAFMVFDGGVLENIIITNVVIECKPFDWFWWGDGDPLHFNLIQRSEIDANVDKAKEAPIGVMRNIVLRNVIARGTGPCRIHGRADAPIENLTIDTMRLAMTSAPEQAVQKCVDALTIENVRNLRLKNIEIVWEQPHLAQWQHALVLDRVEALTLDDVMCQPAPGRSDAQAIVMTHTTLRSQLASN